MREVQASEEEDCQVGMPIRLLILKSIKTSESFGKTISSDSVAEQKDCL